MMHPLPFRGRAGWGRLRCLHPSPRFLWAQGCGKRRRGEERLGTFLFPQTTLLSPCQAPAGLLQRSEPVAGCRASLVGSLVLMRLQAAGRRCGQGSGAEAGTL